VENTAKGGKISLKNSSRRGGKSKVNKSLTRYAQNSMSFPSACSPLCLQVSTRGIYNIREKHIPRKILLMEE
jgi:hypothetical protein